MPLQEGITGHDTRARHWECFIHHIVRVVIRIRGTRDFLQEHDALHHGDGVVVGVFCAVNDAAGTQTLGHFIYRRGETMINLKAGGHKI